VSGERPCPGTHRADDDIAHGREAERVLRVLPHVRGEQVRRGRDMALEVPGLLASREVTRPGTPVTATKNSGSQVNSMS
jgi:hypothetical protein